MKKKYVVWEGRNPGIYDTWDECKAQVNGYTDARFKGFPSQAAEERAFEEGPGKYWGSKKATSSTRTEYPEEVQKNSIAVDVGCRGPHGPMEYRGIDLKSNKMIFEYGPYKVGTSNIGEFLAIVEALKYLTSTGENKIIYSDSKVAMGWVRKKICNTTLEDNDKTMEIHAMIDSGLNWLKNNKYSIKIVKWNTAKWGEIPADYGRK